MKILAFPRDANPYQELLYQPMREQGVTVQYLEGPTTSHTLNTLLMPAMLTVHRLRGCDTVHVHWTFPFRLPFGGKVVRALMEIWAAGFWLLVKLYGMQLVWTAHNAQPHEPVFLDDRRAHRFLGKLADRIIVHTAAAQQQLQDLGVPARRMAIIPHGSYIGSYPDTVTQAVARQKLGLNPKSTVVLLFGLIRPAKGIEQLLEVFQTLPKTDGLVLLVAGAVQDGTLRHLLEQTAERLDGRIQLDLRHISDDEVQYFFRSADFAVLPYEKSTTSGVSLLACSFALPIIAPRQAAFADIPAAAQINYEAGTLGVALTQAAATLPIARQQLGAAALEYAQKLSWPNIATQTVSFLKAGV
jgi:beta-1,4-mannosyltransferase